MIHAPVKLPSHDHFTDFLKGQFQAISACLDASVGISCDYQITSLGSHAKSAVPDPEVVNEKIE